MAFDFSGNSVLAALSPDDRGLVGPHLSAMDLPTRYRLAEANKPLPHAYFLTAGIASMVTNVRHEAAIEIGIVGRDGFANIPLVMGTDRSPNDAMMQVGGAGLRIDADPLRDAIHQSPSLLAVLHRFVHVYMIQTSSTVLANGRATVSERTARWLLMAQDRIGSDTLKLTHEFLSTMLGVRRAGVTEHLAEFERRDIVKQQRGTITIRDREALIGIADGYYGSAEAEFARLFPSRQAD